ncbi:acyltransferase family protein [Flavobacterium gelatinilyticum]|uniref:acyltransferase family protein n=1 Tax=Flavobacterium gelatinilyticum TaxID=3003260 RepID=UPI002480DF0D|nr:acyltransferase [Flavobacterium gelatinilyticum]
MNSKKIARIETLDWLRGLMALSIMFYHVSGWEGFRLESDTILGRLGIYGVSIFFILSGLSMAIVYNSYIINLKTAVKFIIRRVFRIWPLLWLVCFYLFFQSRLSGEGCSLLGLIFNITTLFGFIKPSAYMATGSWSIGNEMVYYFLTPAIFSCYNYSKILGNLFLFMSFIIGFFFSFYLLNQNINLSGQWSLYINPFNNFFLYVSGIAIYYNFKSIECNSVLVNFLLIGSVVAFCFLPFFGDHIVLVTGIGRILFVAICLIIVFCFYKMKINLPPFVAKPLELLGLSTYGVYILHPVIYSFVLNFLNVKKGLLVLVPLLTIFISFFLYNYFELKFINIGKRLTSKK